MSDLLNQASLVMVPSGYKEDIVYSVVPSDGSGDLSFTRASNGTRVNSAGLVEICPWNLISNSENFNAGTWYQENITPTTGQSDPFGASNAFKFLETATTGEHYFFYLFLTLNDGVVTQSIYVKSAGRNQILFGSVGSLNSFIFTFSTETISSVTGFTNTSATSVGNGWYRLTATFTASSPINLLFVKGYNGGLSYAGDTSKGFYAFGGQLNIGSTAKPYFPTTDRLNVPRLTYQNGGGGCPSLLLEKQSTNKVTYSEQFDNADWTKLNATITANSVTSPDGTQNADTITDNTTNGVHSLYQIPSGQSVGAAWTCYMKKGSLNYGYISAVQSTTFFTTAIVNLNDGSIVELQNGSSTTGAVTTEDCGNGWYRVKMQTNANGAGYAVGTSNGSALSGTYKEAIYTGTGSGTIYIWGAQLEDSSYPTSYIPTTSSSATRVADLAYKSSISSLFGASATSFFMDFEITQASSGGNWTVTGYDGSNLFSLCQFDTASNYPRIVFDGIVDTTLGTALGIGRHKIAVSFATNDFRAYIDGALVLTDTSGTYNRYDRIAVNGTAWTGNTNNTNSFKLNQYAQFPNTLTNAELASLTTL